MYLLLRQNNKDIIGKTICYVVVIVLRMGLCIMIHKILCYLIQMMFTYVAASSIRVSVYARGNQPLHWVRRFSPNCQPLFLSPVHKQNYNFNSLVVISLINYNNKCILKTGLHRVWHYLLFFYIFNMNSLPDIYIRHYRILPCTGNYNEKFIQSY